MVSALTDRLLSGYSSSGTNSSGDSGQPGFTAKPTNDGSGYSADQEQLSSSQQQSPPYFIDLHSRHSKRHASAMDDHDHHHSHHHHDASPDEKKRRLQKQAETAYIAHTAREEIARAGLAYPKINTKKPRVLSSSNSVDFSRVSLVHSKDFGGQPSTRPSRKAAAMITASPSPWNVTLTMSPDLCVDALQSLIKSCSAHYRGVSNPPVMPSQFQRHNVSNNGNSPHPFAVTSSSSSANPNATNGNKKSCEVEEDTSDAASTTSSVTEEEVEDASPAPKSTISMGQALSISKQPRVIVIAEAPYTLVHCNAAFLEMTGVSSSKILGHPLVDALDEQTLDTSSSSTGADDDNNNNNGGSEFWNVVHNQSLHMRCSSSRVATGTSHVTCRARLSPIGARLETVTHYSVELDRLDTTTATCGGSSNNSAALRESWERPMHMTSTTEPHLKVVA